jgi:hypothetical protein
LIPTSEGQGRSVLLHGDLDTAPSQCLGRRLHLGGIVGPTESNVTASSSPSVENKEYQHDEGQPDDGADPGWPTDPRRYRRP